MPAPAAQQPAAIPSWTVGDVTVHRVDEVPLPAPIGSWLLPDATPDLVTQQAWLVPDFADQEGVLRLSSHSFAFSMNGRRVLVDTGIGNGKARANPAWNDLHSDYLEQLTAGGFPPDSIDLVILTHLHTDHVGWNTQEADGTWVPTFPRARYLTSHMEWEFWAGYAMDEARRQMFRDSVLLIEAAGLLELVHVPAAGIDIGPGLRLIPTPGHTPGHLAVCISSAGATALITGDCLHHPIQMPAARICSRVDIDPAQAETTRRTLLASLADTDILLLGTHFPPPTAGRVTSHQDGYRLTATGPDQQAAPAAP